MPDTTPTRRTVVRTGLVGTATMVAPSFVQVSSAATDSGEVELSAVSTVPMDTSASVTVYEDLTGDGTVDNQQNVTLSGGTEEFVLEALTGTEGSGTVYYCDVNLSTSDSSVTPSVDTLTVTVPTDDQTAGPSPTPTLTPLPDREKQSPGEIWDNFLVFVAFIVMVVSGIAGLGSRSMAVGALAGYAVFSYIAITTGHVLLEQILYVTLVIVIIGMAMKLWRAELGGSV